ncbi:MAG TPA: Rieske 2Fe-2S domain-containing protein [Anaeromyxobacteraceae bacterium]|nr:Rieske 2Fe-2S domain-containing protein [Anaeromyxobacteraceae bacterium]
MTLSRRRFLLRAASLGGAAAGLGAALPGCAPDLVPAPAVNVPEPVNGVLAVDVASYPDLAREDGAVIARASGLPEPLLLVHAPDGSFRAMSATCTHAGCPVGYERPSVVCPCHLSRFDLDGNVTNPPAVQGLAQYAASFDAPSGMLSVDLLAGDAGFPPLVNGQVIFPLADFPELAVENGWVVGKPAGYDRKIIVVALAGGAYAALDARCTHQGCTVGFSAAQGDLPCPCHLSRFALDGTPTAGPALSTGPLAAHVAASDGTRVAVTIAA